MTEDNGYYSGPNLQAFDDTNTDAYMATDRQEKPTTERLEDSDKKFVKADFIYHEADDSFTYLAGEKLTYGQIKNSGFRGFSVRGKEKVAGEFSLVCSAYNFKKIAKSVSTRSIRLEEAKRLKMAA